MSDHDELGRTLRTLLLQEADAMDIDTQEATERLARELVTHFATARAGLVALVACAVVLVALLVWSNRGDERRGIAPADDRSPSPDAAAGRRTTSTSPTENRRRRPAGDAAALVRHLSRRGLLSCGRSRGLRHLPDRVRRALLLRRPALPCQRRRHGPAPPEPPVRPQCLLPRLVPGRYDAGLPGASGRCRRRRQPLPPRPRHRRADPAHRSRPEPADVLAGGRRTSAPTASASSTRSRAPRSWTPPGTSGRCRSPAANPPGCSRTRTLPSTSPTAASPSSGRVGRRLARHSPRRGPRWRAGGPGGVRGRGRHRRLTGRHPHRLPRQRCPAPARSRQRTSPDAGWTQIGSPGSATTGSWSSRAAEAAVVPGPDYCGSLRPLACRPAWDVCFCLPT